MVTERKVMPHLTEKVIKSIETEVASSDACNENKLMPRLSEKSQQSSKRRVDNSDHRV